MKIGPMKVGEDDGCGNRVDSVKLNVDRSVHLNNMDVGDVIRIHNKEGNQISTSIVQYPKGDA